MKKIGQLLEAAALWIMFALFRIIGPDLSSALGGWIGGAVGPRLAASRKARVNLKNSFPDMPDAELDNIITQMWDNLGRVIGEFPHLKYIAENRFEVFGREHIDNLPDGKSSPLLAFTGHLSNWELFHFFYNYTIDTPFSTVYREPNNPYTAVLVEKCRNPEQKGPYIPKSSTGTRDLVRTVMGGGRVGILIDQKYNQGEPIEFFGRPAMTSTAIAGLALKFNAPILPTRLERLNGCHFRVTVYPPLDIAGKSEEAIMLVANKMLEQWIRERPGQWLWLHRRWDSKVLKELEEREAA